MLVEVCKDQWSQLTKGKPVVATARLAEKYGEIGLLLLFWDPFVSWLRTKKGAKQWETEHLFSTGFADETVWIVEDGDAVTLMYPEDY